MKTGIQDLPNIGRVMNDLLQQSGITTPEELYRAGSREAFRKIRQIDSTVCIRMLYALEGAIQGVKDSQLSEQTKKELLEFYHTVNEWEQS